MMNNYDKCMYCKSFDEYDGCEDLYGDSSETEKCFRANKSKIIEEAQRQGISVVDLLTLINLK